jgi:hypothetical protein
MNTQLYRDIIDQKVAPHMLSLATESESGLESISSRYSPGEVRETIAGLVSEGKLDMASALSEAGLALFPQSEDILAVSGLLAMIKEDWAYAVSILNELLVIQGPEAPITSHIMFIRSLRCAKQLAGALSAVMLAHQHYPNHPDLNAEFESISAEMGMTQNKIAT